MAKCRGIMSGKGCMFNGEANPDLQDFCPDCYNIGEDWALEEMALRDEEIDTVADHDGDNTCGDF